MAEHDDDKITFTTIPTDYVQLGELDFKELNLLFYYQLRNPYAFYDKFLYQPEVFEPYFSMMQTYNKWDSENWRFTY